MGGEEQPCHNNCWASLRGDGAANFLPPAHCRESLSHLWEGVGEGGEVGEEGGRGGKERIHVMLSN